LGYWEVSKSRQFISGELLKRRGRELGKKGNSGKYEVYSGQYEHPVVGGISEKQVGEVSWEDRGLLIMVCVVCNHHFCAGPEFNYHLLKGLKALFLSWEGSTHTPGKSQVNRPGHQCPQIST
jgi:hypothetical protein